MKFGSFASLREISSCSETVLHRTGSYIDANLIY